jgi:hypothetical protein
MDVKGLLRELPWGDVKACTQVGFSKLKILRSRLSNINTGTLIFVCVLRHKEAYVPAANGFQRQLIRGQPIFRGDRDRALMTEATENGHGEAEAAHVYAEQRAAGEIMRTSAGPRPHAVAMQRTLTPTASQRRRSRGVCVPASLLTGDGRRPPRICLPLGSPQVAEDREAGRLSPWRKVKARATRATW